jgi:outer membrane protein assembly factor BamE (lipoprotein component of BamABCDE complex)
VLRDAQNSNELSSSTEIGRKQQPILSKNNLETLSVGRNRQEIQRLMGPPEGKSLDGGNGYLWDYRRAVYDESSDKVYTWTLISFKFLQGKCAYINFQLEDIPPELHKSQTGFSENSEQFNSVE